MFHKTFCPSQGSRVINLKIFLWKSYLKVLVEDFVWRFYLKIYLKISFKDFTWSFHLKIWFEDYVWWSLQKDQNVHKNFKGIYSIAKIASYRTMFGSKAHPNYIEEKLSQDLTSKSFYIQIGHYFTKKISLKIYCPKILHRISFYL